MNVKNKVEKGPWQLGGLDLDSPHRFSSFTCCLLLLFIYLFPFS